MSLESETPRGAPAGREAPRRRRFWFLAGFLAGASIALGTARAWPTSRRQTATPAPAIQDLPPAEANDADSTREELDADRLRARWDALQIAFIKAAEPLMDDLDRAEKLRADLPALQAQAREAEAGYLAAKQARERAEADYSDLMEGKARGVEGQPARGMVSEADLIARQSKLRLDAMHRDRQKAVDSLVAKGSTPATANALASNLYDLRIKAEESRLERLQPILDRVKSVQDRDERFGQPKRLALLHAEIEARRADELACQATWEKFKTDQRALDSRLEGSGLSRDQRRQLDQLLDVIRSTGARPPSNGDPIEFRDFLDRFAARLDAVQPAAVKPSGKSVSSRLNSVVNRLLRVQDASNPSGGSDE